MTNNVGLLNLTECKDTSRLIYFQNEYGTITNKQVIFNNTGIVLNCNEIAFAEIINYKKNYHKTAISISVSILISGSFLLHLIPLYLLFLLAIIVPLPLLFFNKNSLYIKIIKCEIKRIIIPVNKEQESQARKFVNKIAVYRHFNPEMVD